MSQGRLLISGTGSSVGVPVIGCECPVCQSPHPRNKRSRSGALLQIEGKTFVIDAGPDVREQLLKARIKTIDGIILTHAHYDHIGGFDDLKIYRSFRDDEIPCILRPDTLEELRVRFPYLIDPLPGKLDHDAFFSWHTLNPSRGKDSLQGISFEYVTYRQSGVEVLGLKIGNLAYISDIKEYESDIPSILKGIDILIISALKQDPSPGHFSIREALSFAESTQAKTVYLTHTSHQIDYETTQSSLPPGIFLAYDGLEIPFRTID